jgi:hypothetical protein
LHIRNEDYDTNEISINPGSVRQIDLVTGPVDAPRSQSVIIIPHTLNQYRTTIPHGRYRMSVRVSAKNTVPVVANFEIWIDDKGELQCAAL